MSKILSIEVGNSLTKVVETDYKVKQPKVYKYFTIPTPEGVFEDGYINECEEFAGQLKAALSENKIKTKQAVCTVASSKIANREVILPMIKPGQVASAVKANASEYFPIDLSQYEIGNLVLGTVPAEGDKTKLRVMALACEKALIDNYDDFCQKAGLKLLSLDYAGNSLFQIMKREVSEETEMVIKVEEQSTIATVISNQNLSMQRNLAYGIDNMIQTMMASSAFTQKNYAECLNKLQGETCIKLSLSENEYENESGLNEATKVAITDMTEALGPLIGNVGRVIDLYNSKNSEHPITKVLLIGLGSQISGLSKLFTKELGVKTVAVETVQSVGWTQVMGFGNSGEYITAMGAAYSSIGFVNEDKKKNDLKTVNYTNLIILSAVAVLAIISVLHVFSVLPYKEELQRNTMLRSQEAIYLPGEAVAQKHDKMALLYSEIESAYGLTENNNDNIIAFLSELELKLPKEAEVTEFSSDNIAANITIRVTDMSVAAKVIETLREFSSITNVSFGSVSEAEEKALKDTNNKIAEALEEGDVETLFENPPYFVFTAVCTYVPNKATDYSGEK